MESKKFFFSWLTWAYFFSKRCFAGGKKHNTHTQSTHGTSVVRILGTLSISWHNWFDDPKCALEISMPKMAVCQQKIHWGSNKIWRKSRIQKTWKIQGGRGKNSRLLKRSPKKPGSAKMGCLWSTAVKQLDSWNWVNASFSESSTVLFGDLLICLQLGPASGVEKKVVKRFTVWLNHGNLRVLPQCQPPPWNKGLLRGHSPLLPLICPERKASCPGGFVTLRVGLLDSHWLTETWHCRPWKSMVGGLGHPFRMANFQAETVSFRDCIFFWFVQLRLDIMCMKDPPIFKQHDTKKIRWIWCHRSDEIVKFCTPINQHSEIASLHNR